MIDTWDDFCSAAFCEQRDYYFDLYNKGLSDKNIALGLGARPDQICYWKKSRGIVTRKKYTNTYTFSRDTLCWKCKNACGGCNWSRQLKPVEGWTAIITKPAAYLSENTRKIPDYCVIACPEFKKG